MVHDHSALMAPRPGDACNPHPCADGAARTVGQPIRVTRWTDGSCLLSGRITEATVYGSGRLFYTVRDNRNVDYWVYADDVGVDVHVGTPVSARRNRRCIRGAAVPRAS